MEAVSCEVALGGRGKASGMSNGRTLIKGSVIGALAALGLIIVLVVTGSGRNHIGQVVPAPTWANDVCGTIGGWAGEMAVIRQELQKNNYGARPSDGDSGEMVEADVTLRGAVDRASTATKQTLQPGLQRAGIPDSPDGRAAAAQLRQWAQQTERNLLAAQTRLMQNPPSSSYASNSDQTLSGSAGVLARSVSDGLATLHTVATLDPTLQDAFAGSDNCRHVERQTA